MSGSVNIFKLHENIMNEYTGYVKSFIKIRSEKISEKIEAQMKEGHFWPNPL